MLIRNCIIQMYLKIRNVSPCITNRNILTSRKRIGFVTCSGYFYIKKDNTDIRFNVSEEEIKEKFGNVKFDETPDEFINKYGIID